jgi:hypothetical protein
MTTAQMAQLIGREGLLATNGLQVAVKITNVKQSYGRTRYTVTPLHGHGTATVEDFRVEVVG